MSSEKNKITFGPYLAILYTIYSVYINSIRAQFSNIILSFHLILGPRSWSVIFCTDPDPSSIKPWFWQFCDFFNDFLSLKTEVKCTYIK
jgi:hypothetical protein